MAQIKVTLKNIGDITVKSKVVVIDKEGHKAVVANIDFDIDADSSELLSVMNAQAAGHQVNVMFESPQLALDEK